jgi:hypothetical protein
VLVAIGALLLGAAAAWGWTAMRDTSEPAVPPGTVAGVDLNGKVVLFDPGEGLTDAQRAQQDARPDGSGRFIVDAVGLDVPLGSMRTVDGVVTPPDFTSAYHLTNLGAPLDAPQDGTVYVVMHSLRMGGLAPGNYLFDVDSATSKVVPGDTIVVGGLTYRVDSWQTVAKPDLPGASDLWRNEPGRLVVITCLQKPDQSPSDDNFVIIAHQVTVSN